MNPQSVSSQKVWQTNTYYTYAHKGSLDTNHPGMKILIKLATRGKKILDLGCGEGTRLDLLTKGNGVGVDLSRKAIQLAKSHYSQNKYIVSQIENLPFLDNEFDLVYSAYVLEHLINPEKALQEAIRVTARGGYLLLVAPNYGAPNRASPPFKGSRVLKITSGFVKDFVTLFIRPAKLEWNKVEPMIDKKFYTIDSDTIVEPYLGSLIFFLKKRNLKITEVSSCWSEELLDVKLHQKIFRFFGELSIFPFKFWGPHLVILVQKHG